MLNQRNGYLFKFAWRSISRNPGRSFFIGFSVSLAVIIAVWVIAFFDGLNYQIQEAVVKANVGFFQIQETQYSRSTDSSYPQVLTTELEGKLKNKNIKAYSPELVLDGNISTPDGTASLIIIGIEPRLHQNFLPLGDNIISGKKLEREDALSILIGEELAKEFKYLAGDQLVLNYQDKAGELRSEVVTIKGIYRYNGKGFERRFVYLNQKSWQTLFMNGDTGKILFNRMTLVTPDLSVEPEIKHIADSSGLKYKTWKHLNPEMAVVLEFHDGMIKFFFLIIAITITMTVLTPIRMLWQERFKEMRMLSTIGVSIRHFWKMGLFEILLMIALSGFFSIVVLSIIIGYQAYYGVDFRFLNDGIAIERAGIVMPGIIYPLLTLNQLFITFIFVIFVLSFSYLYSIYETLKKLGDEA